jgi:hypothetical protein
VVRTWRDAPSSAPQGASRSPTGLTSTRSLLGEGPCVEAFTQRRPVLVPDLAEVADSRWPIFAAAARRTQAALNSRVIIEQAKGILAERGQIDLAQAFTLLRKHARTRQQRLSDLARDVVNGATIPDALLNPAKE